MAFVLASLGREGKLCHFVIVEKEGGEVEVVLL